MWLRSAVSIVAMLLISSWVTPNAYAIDEAERQKICKQAEERYQEIFGKPSKDESVTIVKMYRYTFCPTALKVKQGATVRWVNVDKRTSHSVWFKMAGKKESDRLFPDENVEMKMDMAPGDYPYECGPHGEQEGMKGSVTIEP